MKDIKIIDDTNFVYRTCAVITYNNKILLQKNTHFNHVTLPGGKCQIGESSIEAVIREIKEEMNIECIHIKCLGIIENFFKSSFDNKKRHEIIIVHELEFKDKTNYSKNKIYNLENKYNDEQYFEWLEINNLNNLNLTPKCLLELIKKEELIYKINKD